MTAQCWLIVLFAVLLSLRSGPVAAQQLETGQAQPTAEVEPQKDDIEQQQTDAQQKHKAPAHVSTSWSTLVKDTAGDFVEFPKRKSTWVILGIGAVTAFGAHFEDDYVQEHIVGEPAVDRFFSLGQWVGSSYVQ